MADVSLLITNQQLIAQGLASGAVATLDTLLGINVPFTPNLGPPGEANVVPPDLTLTDVPNFNGTSIVLPPTPVQDKLTAVSVPALPDFPANHTPAQPAFVLPQKPALLGEFQGGPPPAIDIVDNIPDLNVDALLASITVPELSPIVIGNAPVVALPEFDAVKPGPAPTAPTNLDKTLANAYETALNISSNTLVAQAEAWFDRMFPEHAHGVQTLEARLNTYLAGGSAVDSAAASAMYEIERGKRLAEYRRVDRSALLDAGKRGQVLPDGVMLAMQINARTALADSNASSAADIRKMLFDLEQKNLQFAVTESRAWRSVAISAYQGMFGIFATINGQSIEYARSLVQTFVDMYNAKLAGQRIQLEAYQVEASVYEVRLKAALAPLDVYKAELEAEKLKAEVNEELVRVYEARLRGVEVVADVYAKRIDALIAKGNLQKLRVDLYAAVVQTFVALTQAKEAEWRGYMAEVEGQTALQQSWAEAVRARTAELEGYKAHVEALNDQVRVLLAYNEGVLRKLEAATRVYETQVQAKKAVIESDVQQYSARVEGIARTNEGKGKIASLKLEEWRTSRELLLKKSDQEIARATAEANVKLQSIGLNVKVAEAIGSNYAQMAASALSGINGILSSAQTQSL